MIRLTLPGLPPGAQYAVGGMTDVAVQPSQNVPTQYQLFCVASVLTGQLIDISPTNSISSSVAIS